jgi:uroporphyrin-III C-methyltransferase
MNENKAHFAALDDADFPSFEPGTVWLVGAGPGAPGLISLLGYFALGQADVIIHDALVSEKLLKLANSKAKIIFSGKRGGKPSPEQTDITLSLIKYAQGGKRVLRLKGGDPFVFGRGGEECLALKQANIDFRIVPGITAGIGGLAYAGIPVTHRDTNHAVIFLTGHDENGSVPHSVNWHAIATAAPVIVMYMAVKHLGSICEKLLAAGRPGSDSVAIISNATLPEQTVFQTSLALAPLAASKENIPTPAIVVVGPVNDYRTALDWYRSEKRNVTLG